jgi:hypothetical protein
LQEQLTAANQTISEQSTIIEQLAKDNLTLAARLEQLDHKTGNGLRLAA